MDRDDKIQILAQPFRVGETDDFAYAKDTLGHIEGLYIRAYGGCLDIKWR